MVEPVVVPLRRRRNVRRAAMGVAAAIVALGLIVPLLVLRPLSDGTAPGGTGASGPTGGGPWLAVGTLAALRADHVTYLPGSHAFLVAPEDAAPYALVEYPVVDGRIDDRERVLFCEPASVESPTGPNPVFFGIAPRAYDIEGSDSLGRSEDALARLPVRVVDGVVQVDPSDVQVRPRERDLIGFSPDWPSCVSVRGVPLEGDPGFAIPAGRTSRRSRWPSPSPERRSGARCTCSEAPTCSRRT
jgi:hypothetical protein